MSEQAKRVSVRRVHTGIGVGDVIEVHGERFILTELAKRVGEPPQLTTKAVVELLEQRKIEVPNG